MTWKYTDETEKSVVRTLANGGTESGLSTRADVQEWIAKGNTPEPAYTLAEYKLKRVRDINAEAHQIIVSKWPAWLQRNIALGLDPALTQQCKDDIAAVRVASEVATQSINSALDIPAVQAVTVNWTLI